MMIASRLCRASSLLATVLLPGITLSTASAQGGSPTGELGGGGHRSERSQRRLDIRWFYYVEADDKRLDADGAFKALRVTDPRPLLLIRDEGSGDEPGEDPLAKAFADERVALASRWFRCVRVSGRVLQAEHPLHALFESPTGPPRLMLFSADGSTRREVAADSDGSKLWLAMRGILTIDYEKNAESALARWRGLLNRIDMFEQQAAAVESLLIDKLDKKKDTGNEDKKLAELNKKIEQVVAEETRLVDLVLRNPDVARPPEIDYDGEAAAIVSAERKKRSLLKQVPKLGERTGDDKRDR